PGDLADDGAAPAPRAGGAAPPGAGDRPGRAGLARRAGAVPRGAGRPPRAGPPAPAGGRLRGGRDGGQGAAGRGQAGDRRQADRVRLPRPGVPASQPRPGRLRQRARPRHAGALTGARRARPKSCPGSGRLIGQVEVTLLSLSSCDDASAAEAAPAVLLRGSNAGLEIVVDPSATVDAIGEALTARLAQSPAFFAGNDVCVRVDGRLPAG